MWAPNDVGSSGGAMGPLMMAASSTEAVSRRATASRDAMCDFRAAYIFASGRSPSDALCGPNCTGIIAENSIVAGNAPEHEAKFALCTRHSDLLWLLGYHAELRDGSTLRAKTSPARPGGGAPPPLPPPKV